MDSTSAREQTQTLNPELTVLSTTFSQTITCDPRLWQVANGAIVNATEMPSICSPDCGLSLSTLRQTQLSKCAKTDNVTVSSRIYPVTYMVDLLTDTYKWACPQDSYVAIGAVTGRSETDVPRSAGEYCLPLFIQYNSGNTTSSSNLCSTCNLKIWQSVLSSPFRYRDSLAANYSSLTSSYVSTLPDRDEQNPAR